MPKCLICGYEAKSLQPHLKYKHCMRVSEYYEKFNNAPVYDYNPADRLLKWVKENPEQARLNSQKFGRENIKKANKYLEEHPEVRKEIARKGGETTGSKNLKNWHKNTDPEIISKCAANAARKGNANKSHEFMARLALQNNRYCKNPYKSEKFLLDKKFASSWEVNFIKLCEGISEIVKLTHEPFGIPYVTDKPHKYYPDFLVNDKVLVEIKPFGQLEDKTVKFKKEIAENFCKENPQYTYIILTEKHLYSLRSGEITTSAQQELIKLLMI